jgi:hypothetical protein
MMPVASLPASASGRSTPLSRIRRSPAASSASHVAKCAAGVLVLVGELACQRAQLAAVRAVAQRVALDDRVPPELQPAQRPEPLQPLPLAFEHLPRLQRDHLAHQGVLVGEVMVELRLARVARRPDIVKSGRPTPLTYISSAAARRIRVRVAAPRAVSREVRCSPAVRATADRVPSGRDEQVIVDRMVPSVKASEFTSALRK